MIEKTLDKAHWKIPISSLEPKSSFQICPVWVVLHGTHTHRGGAYDHGASGPLQSG